jgi:hypothetical protein
MLVPKKDYLIKHNKAQNHKNQNKKHFGNQNI